MHTLSPSKHPHNSGGGGSGPWYVRDSELAPHLSWELCFSSAREVFAEQAAGRVELTWPRVQRFSFAEGGQTVYRVKGCLFTRWGLAGLRVRGTILFNRWPGMEPVGAVIETTNYERRVGAVTAVALEALKQESLTSVCLFGAGRLARATLTALANRYSLGSITVFSRTPASSEAFASDFRGEGLSITAGSEVEQAVRSASLIITITTANEPLFPADWVGDETTVVAMGGQQELDIRLLERARGVYVDDLEGCLDSGEIALASRQMNVDEIITGTIAELLTAPRTTERPGPLVLIPRGMASMDVLQAYRAVERLFCATGRRLGMG